MWAWRRGDGPYHTGLPHQSPGWPGAEEQLKLLLETRTEALDRAATPGKTRVSPAHPGPSPPRLRPRGPSLPSSRHLPPQPLRNRRERSPPTSAFARSSSRQLLAYFWHRSPQRQALTGQMGAVQKEAALRLHLVLQLPGDLGGGPRLLRGASFFWKRAVVLNKHKSIKLLT